MPPPRRRGGPKKRPAGTLLLLDEIFVCKRRCLLLCVTHGGICRHMKEGSPPAAHAAGMKSVDFIELKKSPAKAAEEGRKKPKGKGPKGGGGQIFYVALCVCEHTYPHMHKEMHPDRRCLLIEEASSA